MSKRPEDVADWILIWVLIVWCAIILTAFGWFMVRRQMDADAQAKCRADGYRVVEDKEDQWTCVKASTPGMDAK